MRGARAWRRVAIVCAVPVSIVAGGMRVPVLAADPGPDLVAGVTSTASGTLSVGDSFDYTISVTNQGDQTAHDVALSDNVPTGLKVTGPFLPPFAGGQCIISSSQVPSAPPAYAVYCHRAQLPAGDTGVATFTVVVTGDVACGSVPNEVRAKASDEPRANRADNVSSTTVDVACTPAISLTKTVPPYARVGDRVTFTLRASNTGGVAFDALTVTDPGCDTSLAQVADGNGDALMDLHEVWVYRCETSITRTTPSLFTTTAKVAGYSPTGGAEASARATVRVVHPRVTITVTATPVSGAPGDVVTYRYVVRNAGDAVLSDLVVTDDRLGAIGTIALLSPGHRMTLRATRVLSASSVWVVNTATVLAEEPSGRSVTASADASVTLVAATGDGGPGNGSGGTAFTGPDASLPAISGLVLALLGLSLLLAARRRT
jgi:uncharacterized repeat protein (TIGR01451 family)